MPTIDIVGIKVTCFNNKKLYIFVVYIPPSTSSSNFETFLDLLQLYCNNNADKVLLLGDFNTPNYCLNLMNSNVQALINFSYLNDIKQHNKIVNSYGHILDLVFSNIQCHVNRSDWSLVNEDLHHPTLNIKCTEIIRRIKNFPIDNSTDQYNFKKSNFPLMYHMLSNADWTSVYLATDVENACNAFYSILDEIIATTTPKFRRYSSQKAAYPVWYSSEVRHCLKLKFIAHKNYKDCPSEHHYEIFKQYRTMCKNLIEQSYKNYVVEVENFVSANPKKFWSFLQNKKKQD